MAQSPPSHASTGKALRCAAIIVDVRTAAEFAKGAVAGAVNIPLFDNSERVEIGTIYKQIGKQEAVQAGMKFYLWHQCTTALLAGTDRNAAPMAKFLFQLRWL